MNIILPDYEVKVYDPREKENYKWRIDGDQSFSSLENNMYVIDVCEKRKIWSSKAKIFQLEGFIDFIKNAILRQNGIGFFCFSPLSKLIKKSGIVPLDKMDIVLDTATGYFDVEQSALEQLFETQSRIITYEEWIIGCCNKKFERPEEVKWYQKANFWGYEHFLSQPEKINCMFSYFSDAPAEMSTLITHIFDGFDEAITRMVAHQ